MTTWPSRSAPGEPGCSPVADHPVATDAPTSGG